MKTCTFPTTIVICALAFTASAQAETVNCTAITTLPYTITTQGVYCLTGNLSTSMSTGNAITINTNNVVLDLNGFKIGGLGAGITTQANGIYAYQRQNITIKNGTIRGFNTGVLLYDSSPYTTSQGHIIEHIRADQNTVSGMTIAGKNDLVRNNTVIATGGSPATVPGSGFGQAWGIDVFGPGAQVLNNTVTGVTAQQSVNAYGINLASSNSMAQGNSVSNITAPGGFSCGICPYGNDIIITDNRLSNMQYGIIFDPGTTGYYMNNLVQGATIAAYTGGTAAGTTNY